MRFKLASGLLMLAMCACLVAVAVPVSAQNDKKEQPKGQAKDQPKISEGEQQAINKINQAANIADKLKAAQEFVKKNQKSVMRPKVAEYLASEIGKVADNKQKLQLAQQFSSIFNQPGEADALKPILVEVYVAEGKFDEAVNEGNKYLEKHPDDIPVLIQLAYAGANQAQKPGVNPASLKAGLAAADKAVELMEQDKKPERFTPENWNNYRNAWLPKLYQSQGIILFFTGDKVKAREALEKSAGLDQYDPPTLMLLGNIADDEYQELVKKHQAERKDAIYKQALEKMDEVIDWYARAVAATEGDPRYATAHPQLLAGLQEMYGFRNNGKTDGVKALVEKYKKPAEKK